MFVTFFQCFLKAQEKKFNSHELQLYFQGVCMEIIAKNTITISFSNPWLCEYRHLTFNVFFKVSKQVSGNYCENSLAFITSRYYQRLHMENENSMQLFIKGINPRFCECKYKFVCIHIYIYIYIHIQIYMFV